MIAIASVIKLPLLLAAASCGNVLAVAAGILAAGTAEAVLFAWQLRRTAHVRAEGLYGPALRFCTAAVVTLALLYTSGEGWHASSVPLVSGLAGAMRLGLAACALFWGALLGLWWLAGRRAGPERLILENGSAVLRPVLARLRLFRLH